MSQAASQAESGKLIFGNESNIPPGVIYVALGLLALFGVVWLFKRK